MEKTKKSTRRKGLVWRVFGLSLAALLTLLAGCSALIFWKKPPGPASVAAQVQKNIVYSTAAGEELTMDLYFPTNTAGRSLPTVLYLHGGGWQTGGKSMIAMIPGPTELVRRGYLVASVDYRLAPQYKFPSMLEDAKCAVRFLRAHANEFNLDPNRIGVIGESSGGHLAALLGLTDSSAGFEGAGWTNQSSRVQAVVDLYGPTDFATGKTNFMTLLLIKDAFGATNVNAPSLISANPVTYASSDAPPFLIMHGDHDTLVDLQQSAELDARLKAVGADSTFVVLTNFSHGFTPFGLKSNPDESGRARLIADFFDQHLR